LPALLHFFAVHFWQDAVKALLYRSFSRLNIPT